MKQHLNDWPHIGEWIYPDSQVISLSTEWMGVLINGQDVIYFDIYQWIAYNHLHRYTASA